LNLAAVAIIAANLLLPERLVSYRPCCYDENGNLTCAQKPSSAPVVHGDCCDPLIHDLRSTPPPIDTNVKFLAHAPADEALPASSPVPLLPISDLDSTLAMPLVLGPPDTPDVLPLHCRFNI